MRTRLQKICGIIGFSIMLMACQKEVGPINSQHDTFFKKYGGAEAESVLDLLPTDDGGYLLFSTSFDNDAQLKVTKVDASGQELSTVQQKTRKSMYAQAKKLSNGNFVVNGLGSGDYFVISQDGNILSHNELDATLSGTYFYSYPVEANDGGLYVSYGNGYSSGSSENYVSEMNQAGSELSFEYIGNHIFNGKMLTFNLYKVDVNSGVKEYWLTGTMYHQSNWAWSDPIKIFYAHVDKDGVYELTVLDPNDDSNNFLVDYKTTNDNHLISLTSTSLWYFDRRNSYRSDFELVKTNLNSDVVWRKTIDIHNSSGTFPTSLSIASNGEYVVSGFCSLRGKVYTTGFYARISKDGELISQKIYDFGENNFYTGLATKDGGMVFSGYVSDFGKGKEFTDNFLLKTDNEGNYK